MLLSRTQRIGLTVIALFALGVFFASRECISPPDGMAVDGSQGYRVWSGETFKSFEHDGGRLCVPDGWEAVGATKTGWGWATFEQEKTGVLINSSAFERQILEPVDSSYVITVIFPKAAGDVHSYLSIINNSFTRIGRIFNDSRDGDVREHTVLVTAGLAGNTRSEGTRVYPDPSALVSIFVRTPDHSRAEELFIHAVAHLYNRQREDLLAYQKLQTPFADEDWQEMEATWAELAFNTTPGGREGRLKYLYNVHAAVVSKNFELMLAMDAKKNAETFLSKAGKLLLEMT